MAGRQTKKMCIKMEYGQVVAVSPSDRVGRTSVRHEVKAKVQGSLRLIDRCNFLREKRRGEGRT